MRCLEKEDINYFETFAPAVPFDVLLSLVGKFVSDGCHVHHADGPTAFLNGDINGELYASCDSAVYKLKKSLYELKKPPRLCHKILKNTLEGFGFEQYASCECVSRVKVQTFQIATFIHVEALVILGSAEAGLKWIKNKPRYL